MEGFPKRILLATDGSECADSAGRVAVDLANRSGAEFAVAMRQAESELKNRAEELAPLLGSVPEVRLVVDEAAEGVDGVAFTLLEEAAGTPSLISVGSRGLGAVQRVRVGSVSTKVVRAAGGPVLVYPHARAGTEKANGG